MDFLDRIGQGQIIPVIAIVVGGLVGIVAIVSGCLTANSRVKHDAELRKNMLDRGMSAAEVDVAMRNFGVASGTQGSAEDGFWYDAELAKFLAVPHGKSGISYSPEAIDFMLRAFRELSPNEKEPISNAIQEMIEAGAGEEQLIAAVRGLCRTNERPVVEPGRTFDSSEMAANLPLEMRS
jgi:hypothetical protein